MIALYHAARAFAFGYFFALGLFAMTHYIWNWPASYDDAGLLALLSGGGALLGWIGRELRQRRIRRFTA